MNSKLSAGNFRSESFPFNEPGFFRVDAEKLTLQATRPPHWLLTFAISLLIALLIAFLILQLADFETASGFAAVVAVFSYGLCHKIGKRKILRDFELNKVWCEKHSEKEIELSIRRNKFMIGTIIFEPERPEDVKEIVDILPDDEQRIK